MILSVILSRGHNAGILGILGILGSTNASCCFTDNLCVHPKEEEVDLSDYESYTLAVRQIGHFLSDVYMHKRIHWSLGCLTSVEFESHWRSAQNCPVFGGQYTRMELQGSKTLTDYTAAREKLVARIQTFPTNDGRFVTAWLVEARADVGLMSEGEELGSTLPSSPMPVLETLLGLAEWGKV